MTMLEELRSADRRQRVSGWAIAVAVAVVAAIVGWQLRGTVLDRRQPPAQPRPTTSAQGVGNADYQLRLPLSASLPKGWWGTPSSQTSVDFYSGTNGYGVSVGEGGSRPAMDTSTHAADTSVALDAHSQAQWLATRPYLVTGGVTERTLDGRAAWQVDVRERPGAAEVSPSCGADNAPPPCIPLFVGNDGTVGGVWGSGQIRYLFVDLPDGTTVQVSVWDFTGNGTGFGPAQPLVDSLHFSVT